MSKWTEFRPESSLMNPKFDGYRLSLDPLAQYSLKFDEALQVQNEFELDNNLYTLNGIKAFRSFNQLYFNQWKSEKEFFFFDRTHSVYQIKILPTDSLSHLQQATRIYQLPNGSLQGSLFFISDSLALICDGRSKLFVIDITETKWKLIYEHDLDELVTSPIRLLHATCHQTNIDVLIGFINTECHLLWITLSNEQNGSWTLTRRRLLKGKSWPEFSVLETTGHNLYVAIEGEYNFVFDSLIEVKPDLPVEQPVMEKIESSISYIWSQTHDAIELEIQLETENQPHRWSVKIESNHLTCSLNDDLLIDAKLFDTINENESKYVVISDKKNELTITLQKSIVGYFWNDVFRSGRSINGNIKMIDMGETKPINIDEEIKQPYNSQQLEECDQYSNDNDMYLYRIDGDTHKITHQALITNQILFKQPDQSILCIRHDVDGLIWHVDDITDDNQTPWHHHTTLNAFGYVQASKQNRKYICVPHDYSYVAIVDTRAHVYIYKQQTRASTLPGSSLRNRKTGKIVDTISKQYMVSLENHSEILGVTATNEHIFILLVDQFVVITV